MILPRGNIYMVKRIGPNTDSWGTPQVNGMLFEFTPFIRTDCSLSERYDLNHWRATSQTPRWDCSLNKRMLWSMVSNSALKSRSNRMTHCFSSICLNISSCTEVNAVSVLWNFLYEDWNSLYIWCRESPPRRQIPFFANKMDVEKTCQSWYAANAPTPLLVLQRAWPHI